MITTKELYQKAIQNEIMARNLYMYLEKASTAGEIQNKYAQLAAFEEDHKNKLINLLNKNFPGVKVEVKESLMPDLIKSFKVADDIKEAIKLAIKLEIDARDFYVEMAKDTSSEENRKLLLTFANEEAEHKEFLETELLQLQGLYTWYDYSELTGLMED